MAKRNNKEQLALLVTFGTRLQYEVEHLEQQLSRYKGLKRHKFYRYIGERPTTGYASVETNPELFAPYEGHQTILDGLIQLRNEIFTTVEMLDDEPENIQSTS